MNLIASVLHLDRKAIKALRVTDAYSLHRVIYSLYDDVRDDEEKNGSTSSGILYADQGGDIRGRKILMLANREPMNAVDNQYGEVTKQKISEDFLNYNLYRFKVVINPTRRDSASRKLIAVRGREEVAHWFKARAPLSWGFDVSSDHLQVDKINVLQFRDKLKRNVTIGQAHIQGRLRITNKEQFIKSFTQGIGRGRSYGCGLLQIVPVIDSPFI